MPGGSREKWNPYEDKALARIAVDILVNALERSQSVQSFLSDSLVAELRGMREADVQAYLKTMIFHDGMAPNLSSRKFAVDLNRGGDSYIKSVAYYDKDIRPGVNHENVRVDLLFEDGAWHVDRWTREG
ncbi:Mammalian cell entry protein [Tsukamurella hominis]